MHQQHKQYGRDTGGTRSCKNAEFSVKTKSYWYRGGESNPQESLECGAFARGLLGNLGLKGRFCKCHSEKMAVMSAMSGITAGTCGGTWAVYINTLEMAEKLSAVIPLISMGCKKDGEA